MAEETHLISKLHFCINLLQIVLGASLCTYHQELDIGTGTLLEKIESAQHIRQILSFMDGTHKQKILAAQRIFHAHVQLVILGKRHIDGIASVVNHIDVIFGNSV